MLLPALSCLLQSQPLDPFSASDFDSMCRDAAFWIPHALQDRS